MIVLLGNFTLIGAERLDSSWKVQVNAQSVTVNADGSYVIPNISAADQFGRNGPGSPPDFLSDDFLRVVGLSVRQGLTKYAFSERFQIRRGETFTIESMTITTNPPPFPERLRITIDHPTLTALGQTTQLHVFGRLADGSETDVTPRTSWTVYRTSNPNVATVGPDGMVTARGTGVAFLTAINEGATAVARVLVSLGDPGTVVEGFVRDTNGVAVAGAIVSIVGQGISVMTDANGFYSVSNVLTSLGDISVRVTAGNLTASTPRIPAVPGGITDAGISVLEPAQNEGKEFIVVFQPNFDNTGVALSLFISSDQQTAGTVEIEGIGFTTDFSVSPGVVTTVVIPTQAIMTGSDVIANRGIHITADRPVSVYGLNRKQFTTDAFTALPVETFGTRYRVMAHSDLGGANNRSQFAVVAEEENTTVTIVPTASTTGHPVGQAFTVSLNRFEVYQLRTGTSAADLTGTLIVSDKPVGLFSGHSCANLPTSGTGFCDHLCEQIPPTDTWGQRVLTLPLATRLNGDTFRIVADEPGTMVTIAGPVPETFTLAAGQFVQRILRGNNEITANKGILVAQFSNGGSYDGVVSDPFMMLVPPAEQFLRRYTFSTPASGFRTNLVNMVAPAADALSGLVLLDGVPIASNRFTIIAASGFACAKIPLTLGSHTISGPQPLGIYVYGFDADDSYGYPGGMALRRRQTVAQTLLALQCMEDGRVEVTLFGEQSKSYVIEASSDLLNWQPISTNTMSNIPCTVMDPAAQSLPTRFYRAVAQ